MAFIGDGSLSGGEAFEGMNVAGGMKSNLVIIVNDNQMAIAENHGGIYDNLRELRETNGTASNNLFRAFGLDYIYVAEGNNLEKVIEAYRRVKDSDHPVVVHLNTQKGEGYAPAERNREQFHWSVPFDLATGDPKVFAKKPNYTGILCDFIMEKYQSEPRLLVVSSATPDSFGLDAARRAELGEHFLDTNIAEQSAVSVMAGAARDGAKVIYPVVSTFLQRAYDQLMEDWAMDDSPPDGRSFHRRKRHPRPDSSRILGHTHDYIYPRYCVSRPYQRRGVPRNDGMGLHSNRTQGGRAYADLQL